MRRRLSIVAFVLLPAGFLAQSPAGPQQPATAATPQKPAPNPSDLGKDANGNPLRKALKTGHVSNYDESKVGPYTLPDRLVMTDGRRVTDAATWRTKRRPEILRTYQTDKLLGKNDLVTTELPPLDTPLTKGDIGWHYHTGGHTATAADWKAFRDFMGKYF